MRLEHDMTQAADAITVRTGGENDWQTIIEQSYLVRTENGFDPARMRANWREITREFIIDAAKNWQFGCVIAEHDGVAIGSAAGQITNGLAPNVLEPDYRQFGYIWHVYVDSAWRGHRLARRMTESALAHFKALGCVGVRLHTSMSAKPTYLSLGFESAVELQYKYPEPA
jgi:ribosomal protein S18 acetylase RimI-like enzyme